MTFDKTIRSLVGVALLIVAGGLVYVGLTHPAADSLAVGSSAATLALVGIYVVGTGFERADPEN